MTTMRAFRNIIEEGAIIIFFVTILATFVMLGFFVVEKNVTDMLGVYETPSVVYFSQSIEEQPEVTEVSGVATEQISDMAQTEQEANRGINQLAQVLGEKVEDKAHKLILWCVDKITLGMEYLADQIAKILQSS